MSVIQWQKLLDIFLLRNMNQNFTEQEFQKEREKQQPKLMMLYYYIIQIVVGTMHAVNICLGQDIVLYGLSFLFCFGMMYGWKYILIHKTHIANIVEVYIVHTIGVFIVVFHIYMVNSKILYHSPAIYLQRTYNVLCLINSSLGWFPKTLSFMINTSLYKILLVYIYGVDGMNAQKQQLPLYVIFYTMLVGLALRRQEQLYREEMNSKKMESYQKDKLVKVLQLIQDGVLIINNQNEQSASKYNQFNQTISQSQDRGNCLSKLFEGMQFRFEFCFNVNQVISFTELLKLVRENNDYSKDFFFKIEPINESLQINVNHLEQEGQLLIVFKEISAYKKLQKTKHREKFTNIFINSTAHNIFTPINGLIGIMQLIQQETSHMDSVVSYITLMKSCIFNLFYTTQNILEHSKIRLKKFVPELKSENVAEIINKQLDIFQQDASQKRIIIERDIQINNDKMHLDQQRVNLILFNLLSNAIKFSENGKIKVESQVYSKEQLIKKFKDIAQIQQKQIKELYESQCDYLLYISVEDTGQGIIYENQDDLFNLFRKLRISADNINQNGLGLGLSVSSSICDHLQGKLQIEWTKKKKGTRISFYLPALYCLEDDNLISANRTFLQFIDDFNQVQSQDEHEILITETITENYHYEEMQNKRSLLENSQSLFQATKNLQFQTTFTPRIVKQPLQQHNLLNPTFRSQENYSLLHYQITTELDLDYPEILIVDDTVFNVEIISMILEKNFQLSCDKAYSSKQAL
ncbi:multi-sensor hybrid histidine kinase [Stylonychia lemnae]|uniref:Multi-sensor hybrid histidine kinase n=1 Tax=Stylonychia lemnae TaxID=5949 RepID=A0A078BDT8_STYLE|nr:multi-sensor hybrid histidine kinase [Stylonychia lemnae]|eukprot:CDW91743.1 multi-sensor hybrid histidine kinase [Stylonychia lemnae]